MNRIVCFLSFFLHLHLFIDNSIAQSWVQTTAPIQDWQAIAVSANGSNVVAVDDNINGNTGVIYTSTDSGATWQPDNVPSLHWDGVASSADGTHLAATAYLGGIYTSTNSGNTWSQTSAPKIEWLAIASSSDGMKLAASGNNAIIFVSSDGGNTWVTNFNSFTFSSLASSADGTHLIAGCRILSGNILISTDSGNTWNQNDFAIYSTDNWVAVASSADGRVLLAMGNTLYVSTNSGASWFRGNGVPTTLIQPYVACSATGQNMAVGSRYFGLYVSLNYGATWNIIGPTPNVALALSGDGHRLFTSVYTNGIWALNMPNDISPAVGTVEAVAPAFSNLERVLKMSQVNYNVKVVPLWVWV